MGQDETLYDVFVSYNSEDRESVKRVGQFLTDRGLKVFYDEDSMGYAELITTLIEEALLSCRVMLIFIGPHGLGKWQEAEASIAIVRNREDPSFPVIRVLLPGGTMPKGFHSTTRSFNLENGVEDLERLAALFAALNLSPSPPLPLPVTPPPPPPPPRNPYRGLSPFREEDAPFFRGRERLAARLEEAVTEECVTALVGLSGSGKTSVLQAGLLPRLKNPQGKRWEVVSIRPGRHPIYALVNALIPIKARAEERARRVVEGLEPLGALVREALKARTEARVDRFLLVVDPWEELYTLVEDEKERDRFIEGILAETCGQESPLHLLFACRTDFFNEKVVHYKQLEKRLHKRMIHILPLGQEQLLEAIELPLKQAEGRFSFDGGLSERILNDMAEEPGQLPLLQFVLAELWQRRDHGRKLLLTSAYEELGGLQRALNRRADELVDSLDGELARGLFVPLVEVQEDAPDTRRWAHIHEFPPPTRVAIQRLEEQGLLVYGSDAKTGELTVELAHESLLRNWPKLQAWSKEKRSFRLWQARLGAERRDWIKNNRKRDFLLRGGLLKEADHWRNEWSAEFTEEEREEKEFLQKSLKEGRRRHNLWRGLVASILIGFAALVVFLPIRWVQQTKEKSRSLASEALQSKGRGLDFAMLLSLQAYRIADTVEARSSLLTLLEGSPQLKSFLAGDQQDVFSAVFDPSGKRIASGGGRKLYLWEVGEPITRVLDIDLGDDAPITSIAFSADGNILYLSKAKEPKIRRYSWAGEPLPALEVPMGAQGIQNLTLSPRGDGLLAFTIGQQVLLWDHGVVRPLGEHRSFVSKLAFSPDGATLASAGLDDTIFLWSLPGGAKTVLPVEPDHGFNGLAWNPVQTDILAISGTKIQLWNLRTHAPLGPPLQDGSGEDSVVSIAFSPDGETLASAGTDRTIHLWSLSSLQDHKPPTHLLGHKGNIWSLAYSREGKLLSAGGGGEVLLWDPALPPPLSKVVPIRPVKSTSAVLDRDGTVLFVGSPTGGIELYDATTGASLGPLVSLHRTAITSLAADQSGHVLISGDAAGHLFVFRDRAGLGEIPLPGLPRDHDPIRKLVLTPDGKWGAVATKSDRIFTFDVETRRPTPLPTNDKAVGALAIDPTGTRLAVASGQRLSLWDLRERKRIAVKDDAHDQMISSLAFQPGGDLIASGGMDRTVRFWQVKDLTEQSGEIPVPPATALAWSHDGQALAVGSVADGTIALWDVEEHRLLGSGLLAPEHISGLAFRRDGRLLSLSGTRLFEWGLRYEKWRSYACSLLPWSETRPDWSRYLARKGLRRVCENGGI